MLASGASESGRAAATEAPPRYIDLTHPIPTFEPLADTPGEPDLNRPHGDSKAIPSFFNQAVLQTSVNPNGAEQGHFLPRLPDDRRASWDPCRHALALRQRQ